MRYPPLPEGGIVPEADEAKESDSSLPAATSEGEEAEVVTRVAKVNTRKRDRAPVGPGETGDSSFAAPPPAKKPLSAVPLRSAPPAPTIRKPCLASRWEIVATISS